MHGTLILLASLLLVSAVRPASGQECVRTRLNKDCPVAAEDKYAPLPAATIPREPAPAVSPEPAPAAPPEPAPAVLPVSIAPPAPCPVAAPEPLRRSSPLASAAHRSSAPLRPWKWATLAAGVALAGAGAALIAIDGRSGDQCWMPGDVSTCRQVVQTLPAGAALVGAGGAALVSAAVLFTLDARRERRRPAVASR